MRWRGRREKIAPVKRSPNSRHGEFLKRWRDGSRGPANMTHEVEAHLLVEDRSFLISLFHPEAIVKTNASFVI